MAGYLQTRAAPGGVKSTCGTEEEQLSPDLELFYRNMSKVDAERDTREKSRPQAADLGLSERFTVELESEATDF